MYTYMIYVQSSLLYVILLQNVIIVKMGIFMNIATISNLLVQMSHAIYQIKVLDPRNSMVLTL